MKESEMTATLQLVREGVGMELRRGPFQVVLDGNEVGSIESHQAMEIPLDSGHHTLQVKVGRYTSRMHPFDTGADEVVNFRCSGARVWPVYVASIVKPDLALTLHRE